MIIVNNIKWLTLAWLVLTSLLIVVWSHNISQSQGHKLEDKSRIFNDFQFKRFSDKEVNWFLFRSKCFTCAFLLNAFWSISLKYGLSAVTSVFRRMFLWKAAALISINCGQFEILRIERLIFLASTFSDISLNRFCPRNNLLRLVNFEHFS